MKFTIDITPEEAIQFQMKFMEAMLKYQYGSFFGAYYQGWQDYVNLFIVGNHSDKNNS